MLKDGRPKTSTLLSDLWPVTGYLENGGMIFNVLVSLTEAIRDDILKQIGGEACKVKADSKDHGGSS